VDLTALALGAIIGITGIFLIIGEAIGDSAPAIAAGRRTPRRTPFSRTARGRATGRGCADR
jgi:hypothetical protein